MAKIWNREETAEVGDSVKIVDPISDVTRRERKVLLGVSLLQMLIVLGGLLPTKIQTFGIILSGNEIIRLLLILCGVQVYFIIAFWIYSTADLKAWAMERTRLIRSAAEEQAEASTNLSPGLGVDEDEFYEWLSKKQDEFTGEFKNELERHFRILSVRAFFERWVPIIIGLFALLASLHKIYIDWCPKV